MLYKYSITYQTNHDKKNKQTHFDLDVHPVYYHQISLHNLPQHSVISKANAEVSYDFSGLSWQKKS